MLVIYPPEYLPRAAFFAQMQTADTCVLADTLQYSRQSYQNRTKIRNPNGWQWISVPLIGGQHGRGINDVEIDNRKQWARQHLKALEFNYRSTPFFDFYYESIAVILGKPHDALGVLLCEIVEVLHRMLQVAKPLARASQLPGAPQSVSAIQAVIGDADLLSSEEAARSDARHVAELSVFSYTPPVYRQNFTGFEPGMSVLDLLFNYGPEATRMMQQGAALRPYVVNRKPE